MGKIITFLISMVLASTALAWEPTKPVRVLIGFAPGSGNELSFRGVSSIIEKADPKINFVIENRPGADGVVAMNDFIKLPNDGHHIYIPSHQGIWVTADFYNSQAKKYTLEDFDYVLSIAKSPLAVIASSTSNVNSIPELLKKVTTTTQPVSFAAGSGAHKLAFDFMASKININKNLVQTIPYKGPAQAAQDVAGGIVEFGIVPAAVAATLARSEKIKILGLCSEEPVAGLENVPLMNKWVPGMNVYAAWGIILPKNTDTKIRDWYVSKFSQAIRSPEAKKFFDQNYMFYDPKELTPAGFKESMMSLRKQWVPILEQQPKPN